MENEAGPVGSQGDRERHARAHAGSSPRTQRALKADAEGGWGPEKDRVPSPHPSLLPPPLRRVAQRTEGAESGLEFEAKARPSFRSVEGRLIFADAKRGRNGEV
ncbi:hypothetical protein KM043_005866 [Ampulex compressa]|nr:hypothetical protein KM043_005866 [Ampulex compressa]